jgi:uncharacterized protein (UPF0248 family)
MIPIQDLLNRILWDEDFGRSYFEVGYFDHKEQRLVRVPFQKMVFEDGNHFSFQIESCEGGWLTIPLHRVKEVFKDGDLIWQRRR